MRKIKILMIAVFAIAAAGSAYAQAELALGIKGGINLASLNNTSSVGGAYDNRTGYHAGAYFMIKLTKIAIQPEILFSQQGQKLNFNGQSLSSNYDYISVPIMLKLYLVAGLNLQAGAQFGFLSNASGDVYNSASNTISGGQNLSSFVNSTDFSVPVGIGWDLPLGLNITARYNIGVSEVNKNSGSSSTTVTSMGNNSAKNQVFQFSVGFRIFKFGK